MAAGGRGDGELGFHGDRISVSQNEISEDTQQCERCATEPKMVKMVEFMFTQLKGKTKGLCSPWHP